MVKHNIGKIAFAFFILIALFVLLPLTVKADTQKYIQETLDIYTSKNVHGANTPMLILTDGEKNILTRICETTYVDGYKIQPGTASSHTTNPYILSVQHNGTNITDSFTFSESNWKSGDVIIVFVQTVKGSAISTDSYSMRIHTVKNQKLIVETKHLTFSSADKDKFDGNVDAFIEELYNSISIYDAENMVDVNDAEIIYNGNEIKSKKSQLMKGFKKGNTYCLQVDVTDNYGAGSGEGTKISKPFYITFLDDETEATTKVRGTRAISPELYPFSNPNIKTSGGMYFAKMEDHILYYIDKNGDFLLNHLGNKYPVDACLTAIVEEVNGDIYTIRPLSKWIVNDDCKNLLVNCFNQKDGTPITEPANYIEVWQFKKDTIEHIRNDFTTAEMALLDNFYINYKQNGYCVSGERKPNELSRADAVKTISGTALTWRIEAGVLYIEARENATPSDNYSIPNFGNASVAPWAGKNFHKVVFDDKITQIGSYAFTNNQQLTEAITLPKNCVIIGKFAFQNCVNLQGGLDLKNVMIVEQSAFESCSNMAGELKFGTQTVQIGANAFKDTAFKGSIKMQDSQIVRIESGAFENCTGFTGSVLFSSQLAYIGDRAFAGCSNITGDVILPGAVKSIGDMAFANCEHLDGEIALQSLNLETIGNYAFANCVSLQGDIALPQNLKKIGDYAFKNCRNIRETLVVNEKLEHIGVGAFYGCNNLTAIDTSLVKNKGPKYIGDDAFYVDSTVSILINKLTYIAADNQTQNNAYANYHYASDHRRRYQ